MTSFLPCHIGGNPDSNTLISDTTTVICLDDYHCLDRKGRAEAGVTALDPKAQDFDLMYNQVGARSKPEVKLCKSSVSGEYLEFFSREGSVNHY